ncbi:MAG: hypothetical protein M3R38_10880 [Actinomycetota bacterium]|nr:hypothetical protein [Actinomycetota bacterium]
MGRGLLAPSGDFHGSRVGFQRPPGPLPDDAVELLEGRGPVRLAGFQRVLQGIEVLVREVLERLPGEARRHVLSVGLQRPQAPL